MNSKELLKIKKTSKVKKVLFINPKRRDCKSIVPHNGLAILSGILKKRGHKVLIVDYQLIHDAPEVSTFINDFKPDVIGMSLYTPSYFEAEEIITRINQINKNIPLIVGGPHATLYPDLLQKDKRIDYISVGEAELTIIGLIENAKKEKIAKIVKSEEDVILDNIPFPDYKSFYNYDLIRSYPIMTSRGCPFRCSFCIVGCFSRRWRPRNPDNCIRELEFAKKELSKNLNVIIQDDNPLVDKKRFYDFLDKYNKKINMRFSIINTRADNIDEKLVKTLKDNHCESICVAVESADPHVFSKINKGETLQQIENAAKIIREQKMPLLFCFVIGLPGDTLERTKNSIRFVNKYKPGAVFWNMSIPFRNTEIRKWYEENGTIFTEIGKTSYVEGDFVCDEPAVETPEFTKWDRKKAYYMCILNTTDGRLKIRKVHRIFKKSWEYGLLIPFLKWLPRGIYKSFTTKIDLVKKGIAYYRREGFISLFKRIKYLIAAKRL